MVNCDRMGTVPAEEANSTTRHTKVPMIMRVFQLSEIRCRMEDDICQSVGVGETGKARVHRSDQLLLGRDAPEIELMVAMASRLVAARSEASIPASFDSANPFFYRPVSARGGGGDVTSVRPEDQMIGRHN